ncbi:MAG: hypothetical protein GF418_03190 [Chitinivibrionales bacterium]|nr:hypothetical protein [Chitinivibrionales bacterium]MBD3394607.1 hypothetical protein [Chitinivibrionales bacterium]
MLKIYLLQVEGIDCASPKGCFRQALKTGILTADQTEKAILMCDDRNLVSHTYIESVAHAIYERLGPHAQLIRALIEGIRSRAGSKA